MLAAGADNFPFSQRSARMTTTPVIDIVDVFERLMRVFRTLLHASALLERSPRIARAYVVTAQDLLVELIEEINDAFPKIHS